jgi:hypothetical protein
MAARLTGYVSASNTPTIIAPTPKPDGMYSWNEAELVWVAI